MPNYHRRERRILYYYDDRRLDPKEWLRFVYLPGFEKRAKVIGLNDDDLRSLEISLMIAPNSGKVIEGTNGLRKLRFAKLGKGKRSGLRVCYVFFELYEVIYLVSVFDKNEKDDLSQQEKNQLGKWIARLKSVLDKGKGNEEE